MKRFLHFLPLLAFFFGLPQVQLEASTGVGAGRMGAGTGSVTITNNTGYPAHYLHVSPATDSNWGDDRLASNEILESGGSKTVSLPLGTVSNYDIRLIDSDGDSYTRMNVRLTANQNVVFTFDDFDGGGGSDEAPAHVAVPRVIDPNLPTIRISNRTGYSAFYVYVSPSTNDRWGSDVLAGDEILYNDQTITLNLPHQLNVTNRYDIRLKDSDGDTYTKMNVLVTNNGLIEFVFDDIDAD